MKGYDVHHAGVATHYVSSDKVVIRMRDKHFIVVRTCVHTYPTKTHSVTLQQTFENSVLVQAAFKQCLKMRRSQNVDACARKHLKTMA